MASELTVGSCKVSTADGAYGFTQEDATGVKTSTYSNGSTGFVGTQSSHPLSLMVAGSGKVTIDSAGLATFSNGIAFTQTGTAATGAATTSSTLDHYEEGTWTPVLNGVTGAATTAYYTRIGRVVHVTYYSDSMTSTAVAAQFTGLPFPVSSTSRGIFTTTYNTWAPGAGAGMFLASGTTGYCVTSGSTTIETAVAAAARYFQLSGTYITA